MSTSNETASYSPGLWSRPKPGLAVGRHAIRSSKTWASDTGRNSQRHLPDHASLAPAQRIIGRSFVPITLKNTRIVF